MRPGWGCVSISLLLKVGISERWSLDALSGERQGNKIKYLKYLKINK